MAYDPTKIRIATTTSVVDSGLMEVINTAFQAWQSAKNAPTVYHLDWENPNYLSLGSGAAMDAARNGLADIVISHDRIGELLFLAECFALVRNHLFFNYFSLVGPADTTIAYPTTLLLGFQAIASLPYVSRGAAGRSGTWIREQQILNEFSITLNNILPPPVPTPPEVYPGMMATLSYTADLVGVGTKAYTLTDIGTWYQFQQENAGRLVMLTSPNDYLNPPCDPPRDPLASNQYVGMLVNPGAKFLTPLEQPINTDGAHAFLAWMHTSSGDNNARDAVNTYRVNINTDPQGTPILKQGFIYNACSEHFPDDISILKPVV